VKIISYVFILIATSIGIFFAFNAVLATDEIKPQERVSEEFEVQLSSISIPFIQNTGQLDENVKFYADTFAGRVFVTNDDITYAILHNGTSYVIKEHILGENLFSPIGEESSPTNISSFIGNESDKWKSQIPSFDSVSLGEMWNGVDIQLYAYGNNIEKLFTVHPYQDVNKIQMTFDGISKIKTDDNDNLILYSLADDSSVMSMTAPIAYQMIDDKKIDVAVNYKIINEITYGFEVGDYDENHPLVIDPLIQATYLGGTDKEEFPILRIDSNDNVFVTGDVFSSDFPQVSGGADNLLNGTSDIFVSKLNNELTSIMQSTYVGGSGDDFGYNLNFDSSDNVYIYGQTKSDDLPELIGANQTTRAGGNDVFITKLNNGLTDIIISTYFGTSGSETPSDLDFDSSDDLFISGFTNNDNLPWKSQGNQTVRAGGNDVFVAKLNKELTTGIVSTYLGGSGGDGIFEMRIDSSDNVFVTGGTGSSDFPKVDNGAFSTKLNATDIYVSKLSNDLADLYASTYLGGNLEDSQPSIFFDSSANVFITYATKSTDVTQGVSAGYQTFHESDGGKRDVIITKLNNDLDTNLVTTYLGGDGQDDNPTVVLDSSDNVYVVFRGPSTDLPGTSGGIQESLVGTQDLYIARLNNALTSLTHATYLGESGTILDPHLAIDSDNNLFVAAALSTDGVFPGTEGGAQSSYGGGTRDIVIVKLTLDLTCPILPNNGICASGAQTLNNRIEIDDDDIPSDIEAGDLFGYAIENIGDLDMDGVTDLATIKFKDDSGAVDVGSISIMFMNTNGTVRDVNEITMEDDLTNGIGNGCFDDIANQRETSSLEQLAFVGDLINGNPTLALGAADNNSTGLNGAGVIYMLELTTAGKVATCERITDNENGFDPDDSVYLEGGESFLGWPLIATDVNGDGQNELIAGASNESDTGTNLWTLFLRDNGVSGNIVDSHPDIPIFANSTHIGIDSGDYIDDGDTINGAAKIVVGVQDGGTGGGSIFIVNLNSTGYFSSSTEITGVSIGEGIDATDRFGSGVAPLQDMNGDGINDLLVGNELGDDGANNAGEAYILLMNSNDSVKNSQKISNESVIGGVESDFLSGGDLFGHGMTVWMKNGITTVVAISAHQDDTGGANAGAIHLFYIERAQITVINKSGGGCNDCTPPTFGKNKNGKLLVSDGFIFNGNATDVTGYHTDFPLITVVTNQTNTVIVKMYENNGVNNIRIAQFGMGMPEIGDPLNKAQILLEVWIVSTEIEKIKKIDKNNLVEILNVSTSVVNCGYVSNNCLQVTVDYVYRDQPKYNTMAINAWDNYRNSATNFINDGVLVIGETLNKPPEQDVTVAETGALYPQKRGLVTLSLLDYKTDVWQDEYGYKWSTNNYGPYLIDEIPVPEKIQDKFSIWTGYNDRHHSEFKKYVELQTIKADGTASTIYYKYDKINDEFVIQKAIEPEDTQKCFSDFVSKRESCVFGDRITYEIKKAELIAVDYSNRKY
jgi:hypothetical protein